MINILNNLISSAMLPFGFAIDSMILLLLNPIGFVAIFSSLIFFEYKTAESIIKNTNLINIKEIFNYIRKHKTKNTSLIFSQWAVLNMIFKKENIRIKKISENVGITIGNLRKLMNNLFADVL